MALPLDNQSLLLSRAKGLSRPSQESRAREKRYYSAFSFGAGRESLAVAFSGSEVQCRFCNDARYFLPSRYATRCVFTRASLSTRS